MMTIVREIRLLWAYFVKITVFGIVKSFQSPYIQGEAFCEVKSLFSPCPSPLMGEWGSVPDSLFGTIAEFVTPFMSGAPSFPSSVNDSSLIRKNRHTPLGERIQSSREITGEHAMSRRAVIVSGNLRYSSVVVQRRRRTGFTHTNAIRPELIMVKSQVEPDFGW